MTPTEHSPESSSWRTLLGAAFVAVLGSSLSLAIHYWMGLNIEPTILESQIWFLLALAIGSGLDAMVVAFGLVRPSALLHRTIRLAMAMTGISILALHGLYALNVLLTGTGNERFAYYIRAFGNYFWFYWLLVVMLGALPAQFLIARLRSQKWFCIPALILIATMSAFYLRVNFVIKYSKSLPSSWQQFFWPF